MEITTIALLNKGVTRRFGLYQKPLQVGLFIYWSLLITQLFQWW